LLGVRWSVGIECWEMVVDDCEECRNVLCIGKPDLKAVVCLRKPSVCVAVCVQDENAATHIVDGCSVSVIVVACQLDQWMK
jgi:hypothetical protein